ncbi:hypothetical protein [Ferrovibrio sp.]|uniref:hypothetical protein n=1 Tax=Ferrovibrio sp. TaxID=1917215 RepID=UPI0025B89542|nr:hypothetical protein [Ferrovibrio sp.]MBX3454351.1 hypothetical protein [Ferrovibrio sp.]
MSMSRKPFALAAILPALSFGLLLGLSAANASAQTAPATSGVVAPTTPPISEMKQTEKLQHKAAEKKAGEHKADAKKAADKKAHDEKHAAKQAEKKQLAKKADDKAAEAKKAVN